MTQRSLNDYALIIGQGLQLTGNVREAQGRPILILGTHTGDLESNGPVEVGPEGHLDKGHIKVKDLSLAGTATDVTLAVPGHLHLAATARLTGEAEYGELSLDRGAVIRAKITGAQDAQKAPAQQEPPVPLPFGAKNPDSPQLAAVTAAVTALRGTEFPLATLGLGKHDDAQLGDEPITIAAGG